MASAGRQNKAFFRPGETGKKSLCIRGWTDFVLSALRHEKGRGAGNAGSSLKQPALRSEEIGRKTQRNPVMTPIFFQGSVEEGVESGVVTIARSHSRAQSEPGKMVRKKSRQ